MKSLLLLAAMTATAAAAPLHRYALVIGSNNGGGERVQLRYAGHDAATIADVLQQIGGVKNDDLSLLKEPDLRSLDSAFDALSERVASDKKRGQRTELVVYYSGHADETGILIGGAHYDYARLRSRIKAVPADVNIAILDSCASGSFTRLKGGTKSPPFLQNSSNQVEGFAFLSSSSADEDAQESDKIGASFFTYYFVAGLRGAADRNHDGKITLTEAYQFAYEQTFKRTLNTAHGPQHPAYDMHLSGTGDVVITDLRSTESTLVLPKGMRGHITIVDTKGNVAVELSKEAGDPLSLALPNQTYNVHVDTGKDAFEATVTIDHAGDITFDSDSLHEVEREPTVARGDDNDVTKSDDDDDDHEPRNPWYRVVDTSFGGGLRVERPQYMTNYDGILTLGGTMREVRGAPVVGVAETGNLALGLTLGNNIGFAYAMDIGFGPGVFIGDNLQVGATVGFGFSGITSGILDFGWTLPTEIFAILELSPNVKPMAYFRQTYVFDSAQRQNGSKMALWGDESEAGAGLKFSGKLDGFIYGSLREAEGQRFWGIGLGAIL
ncbi:MAG: caspase family protein [Kofleriaceae bacterium]